MAMSYKPLHIEISPMPYAACVDPDQTVLPFSLIRVYAICLSNA